jgi:tetratricopeptide (TPR) repeat protein
MLVLAGAFGTFVLFLFLGLGALAVTAALDRALGKERALLAYVVALLALTVVLGSAAPIAATARPQPVPPRLAGLLRLLEPFDVAGDPFARPPLEVGPSARNPFRKHSDTRPLDPIALADPPWPELPFSLPPTVPGPAPGARHLLRGPLPRLSTGDGTSIGEIPDADFQEFVPRPSDLFDAAPAEVTGKVYVYITAILEAGVRHDEGSPGYEQRKWRLVAGDVRDLQVEWAYVGPEDQAAQKMDPSEILRMRRRGQVTPGDHFSAWALRDSVANHYARARQQYGVPEDLSQAKNIDALKAVAQRMAQVGATGQEDREGWRIAARLLEAALVRAREIAEAADRAEILRELTTAYAALRDERRVLETLAEYARTSPKRPEPWTWLGRLHLERLALPVEAERYFLVALDRTGPKTEAQMGRGDALSARGLHEEALAAYREAGREFGARVREAEALLRLGRLGEARGAADAAIALSPGHPRGQLALGAIHYAGGDLEAARAAFTKAAAAREPAAYALRFRAQAAYNLGLTLWRLGSADAALAAFDAAERALRFGSEPSRFPDETISPEFGRALVGLAAGNEEGLRSGLQRARQEAPRVAYHEMLAGMLAADPAVGNFASAVRAFDRALTLARDYPELDGWLARTRLGLGEQALGAGTPIAEAAADFEAAVAFASRAGRTEVAQDPKAFAAQLREAWIRTRARHLAARPRYESARAAADRVLSRVDREQPAALTLRGYANYSLGEYDQCIRDFQAVLDKVPAGENPWREWRAYAAATLAAVKHWRSLEEKTIDFSGGLVEGWTRDERAGVRMLIEDGALAFRQAATTDGRLDTPTVQLTNEALFDTGRFEEIRFQVRIPRRDARGSAVNNITFGLQVQRSGRRGGLSRQAGVGVFYDRGKVAVRFGQGREERWKDGELHRLVPEVEWPSDGWMGVRIARLDREKGTVGIFLDPDPTDGVDPTEPVATDEVSGFKEASGGKSELWIGGYATQAQPFDVAVRDIRIVRIKE